MYVGLPVHDCEPHRNWPEGGEVVKKVPLCQKKSACFCDFGVRITYPYVRLSKNTKSGGGKNMFILSFCLKKIGVFLRFQREIKLLPFA